MFFIYYYEDWPTKTRDYGTPAFMTFLLSFHITTQDYYYEFMADFNKVLYTTAGFVCATILVGIALASMRCRKRLKYRMEFTYVDQCNWYRWIYWLLEILYVPLLVNATWCGNCSFYTKRAGLEITDCGRNSDVSNI